MAKSSKSKKSSFQCQECGARSARWVGRCLDCGAWDSMAEVSTETIGGRGSTGVEIVSNTKPVPITEVKQGAQARIGTGIGELDRVLGGGLVPGAVVLIGGDPGIGKSTLLLQVMHRLGVDVGRALYVSAEESLNQVRLRAERIGALSDQVFLMAERSLDTALSAAADGEWSALVLDSVQTLVSSASEGVPGALSQVREVATQAMKLAKSRGLPVFLVGHVTKEGSLAGPKVLEHLVDTVLYFEGERGLPYRILRAHKNRFGSTDEIGVFEMRAEGLGEVSNPSRLFLSERATRAPGSVVVATLEGQRPLLVEVQALVSPCAYGSPRRTSTGFDSNRVSLLAAVVEKREEVPLLSHDIFLNVAGGLRLGEPAVDLAVVAAMVSSMWNRPVDDDMILLGEVGLGGEVRQVGGVETRMAEASKLGFARAVIPSGNFQRKDAGPLPSGVDAIPVASLKELLAVLF